MMNRREMLGLLGASGLALIVGGKAFAQGEAVPHEGYHHEDAHHGDIHARCAAACADCMTECNKGAHHCYQQVVAGKRDHAKAMHLCADCGEFCATSAKLVARMSPLMTYSCSACAGACDATIAECEKLNDPAMNGVIDSLRKCAASCREMVQAMGGHHHHHDHGHREAAGVR